MATISFGNLGSVGGKNVITGGSSGYDTEKLITALTDAKRLPATKLEATVKNNTAKVDALNELSSLLKTFKDASNFLRNPPGVSNESQNVFKYRSADLSSEAYFTATVAAGTATSSYDISVDQLATKQVRVTNTFALANTNTQAVGGSGPFNAGTLKLGPSLTQVTLADGDTLNDVMNKINAVKDTSKVEATLTQVSSGNYRITFKSTETGAAQNFDFDANNAGILNGGFFSQTNAVDAKVTLDGTQVTRSTNTISDLISGVTLNLKAQSSSAVNMKVESDTESVKTAIQNFVDAYNAFRAFAAKQTATDDSGNPAKDAVLGSDTALRTLIGTIGSQISASVSGLTGNYSNLAQIGITLTDYQGDEETPFTRNILQVTETSLDSALASNFDDVAKMFGFNYTSDNTDFVIFTNPTSLPANNISFNINQTTKTYTATIGTNTINLTATTVPGGGISLKPTDPGTALDGMQVIFAGTGNATVNLTATQGIADQLYGSLNSAVDDTNGIVAQQVQGLKDRNNRLDEDISRIDGMIESYRDTLLERFSRLESAISSVNSILQLLDANAAARQQAS